MCASMDKFKKQSDRVNKTETNSWLWIITAGWLGGGILLGWLLSFMIQPPSLILSLFSNFEPYVNDYKLFCLIMMTALFLMPFSFLLILKFGFDIVSFESGGWLLVLMSVPFLIGGLGIIGFKGSNKYAQAVRAIISSSEWLGAVLYSFICLFFFMFCIACVMKNRRSH